jgi:hypothetical protein
MVRGFFTSSANTKCVDMFGVCYVNTRLNSPFHETFIISNNFKRNIFAIKPKIFTTFRRGNVSLPKLFYYPPIKVASKKKISRNPSLRVKSLKSADATSRAKTFN